MPRTPKQLVTVMVNICNNKLQEDLLKKCLFCGPDFHFYGDRKELSVYLQLRRFLQRRKTPPKKQIIANPRLMIILMTHIISSASMLL